MDIYTIKMYFYAIGVEPLYLTYKLDDDEIIMISMLFTIRFYSQFHRTQPELLKSVQQELHDLVQSAGGKITHLGKYTTAEFSEDSFTFTIQFFNFMQQLVPYSEKLRTKLLGFSIIFLKNEVINGENLFKPLIHEKQGLGIYVTSDLAEFFTSLFILEPISRIPVYHLKALRSLAPLQRPDSEVLVKRFSAELESSEARCKILLGKDTELLLFLSRTYIQQQYSNDLYVSISFNNVGASLNGFIELFMQSLRDRESSFAEYREKVSLLKAERLHEMYNEEIQSLLRELLAVWLGVYESVPVVLYISHLDAMTASLQPIMKQFLFQFLKSPSHRVHITARDKESLYWIDEIDRHFVIIQSPEGLLYGIPEEDDRNLSIKTILPAAYLCHKLSLIYTKSELPLQLERTGFSPASVQWLFEAFNKTGIFPAMSADLILNPDIESTISTYLQEYEKQSVHTIVQERLLESLSKHELNPGFGFLSHFIAVNGKAGPDLILDCVLHDLSEDYFSELDHAVKSEELKKLIGNDLFESVQFILVTDHLLASGSAQDLFEAQQFAVPALIDNPRITSFCYINAAALQLVSGDLVGAGQAIKEALILLQDYKNKNGLEKVYRIFGLIELAQHRIEDGIEYLTFALDAAQRFSNKREKAMSHFYSAVAYFLQGNLPRAMSFADTAMKLFHELDHETWEQKCAFLLGRIYFTLGSYERAAELFAPIQDTGPAALWSMKAALYASIGNRPAIERLAASYDAMGLSDRTLEIEFHYFLESYEACIQLCETALNEEPPLIPCVTEQVDWTDGYAQIESLLFPRRDFLLRQYICFKALSMSQLNPQDHTIISILDKLLDELKPGFYDPYDIFYATSYYLVLQRVASTEIDRATALSSAFKRLQKRASRIEDAELRRSYLTVNYWNGLLSRAAKLHNLI